MSLGAPQIIYIVLIAIGVGSAMAKYGQPKTDKYDLTDVLISPAIVVGLLWWGGFFS